MEKYPCPVELNVKEKNGRSSSHLLTILDGLHIDLGRFPLRGHSENTTNEGEYFKKYIVYYRFIFINLIYSVLHSIINTIN